ncbi:MAG TPA: GtrA family protein [Verrucomicrobiae bacterium]|nr:GtrA family protein [Verrucomicrobiae bacterium]
MKNSSLLQKHRHFLLYGLIGGSGATLDFLLFLLLFNVFGVPAAIATTLSVFCGITNNFILNAVFNFKTRDHLLVRYGFFLSVGIFGLLLSIIVIALGSAIGIHPNISKLISIPLVVVLQYFLNKHLSFQNSPHKLLSQIKTRFTKKGTSE